jgi:hypothetical protein
LQPLVFGHLVLTHILVQKLLQQYHCFVLSSVL